MLGFLPDECQLSSLQNNKNSELIADYNKQTYKPCFNYSEHDVCNWMLPVSDPNNLCVSCRLNKTIPKLSKGNNKTLWFLMEQAKRRFLYSAIKLKLPILGKAEDPKKGLGFNFLEDQTVDDNGDELFVKKYITTGHSDGVITLNLNEADDTNRISMREKMNEKYRTLLGHFRHESGHYYWDRLIKNSDRLAEFRQLFGDERLDYKIAMENYYKNGPATNWQNVWISAYATMHPWEDWAETWAHYLHMVDTLETASNFNVNISDNKIENPYTNSPWSDFLATEISFTQLFNNWCSLTEVLNALNKSMGLDDAYPFVISISSLNKLRFVHQTIMQNANE